MDIILKIEQATGIDIRDRCRQQRNVYARMIACKIMREQGMTLANIGKIINRTHDTVIYLIRAYDNEIGINKDLQNLKNKIAINR